MFILFPPKKLRNWEKKEKLNKAKEYLNKPSANKVKIIIPKRLGSQEKSPFSKEVKADSNKDSNKDSNYNRGSSGDKNFGNKLKKGEFETIKKKNYIHHFMTDIPI